MNNARRLVITRDLLPHRATKSKNTNVILRNIMEEFTGNVKNILNLNSKSHFCPEDHLSNL